MAEQKTFLKKHEVLIVILITILFIYLISFFNQKINFLLGNELIVYLSPQQKSFNMHYGDVSKVDFEISIDNVAYCKADCSYLFTDRSRNEVIDKVDFIIEKNQQVARSYDISVKRLGSGQDIYSLDLRCHSIRSFICLTDSPEKFRSSLIAVNYDLTETEKELKKTLRQNVTKLLGLLSNLDILHQQVNQKYFDIGFKVNLLNLSKQKIDIDDAYDKIRISIENLRSIWSIENYIRLNQLFNQSFFDNLENIKMSIENLDNQINKIVSLHNDLLSKLSTLHDNLKELRIVVNILQDNKLSDNTDATIKKFNNLGSIILNNTFSSYNAITEEFSDAKILFDTVSEKSKIPVTNLFFYVEYSLQYENDLLCSLKQDCKENFSIAKIIKNVEKFLDSYPNASTFNQSCDLLRELNDKYNGIRNETGSIITEKNNTFPSDDEFAKLAIDYKDNEIRKINNSYYDSFDKIRLENKTSLVVVNLADLNLPKNKTKLTALNYNESINISLYLLSKINLSDETLAVLNRCQKLNEKGLEQIGNFSFEPINTNITYSINSRIDTNLSDNPSICCIFNECRPCCNDESCKNDEKTFPIILLHGHSLAKDNSPEFSLDSFNKLQTKLQEDGYMNVGTISLYSRNEPLQKGVWGLSGKPVIVKVSYYYDAFRKDDKYIVVPTKSENIDTYALRLKDLIDIVKDRTNKPKVNIIAHSMGGLVVRRYIQIFGENDIEKLILMSTPNKGISGQVSNYCELIGENRECQDMNENSLFINKLNNPLKQPSKIRLYTIIGQGCQMKLGDGDGIVLTENAKLENAETYYINGTCGGLFGENLHTEILDIDKYPDSYKIINEILRK